MTRATGLMGGSFNPAHGGHRAVSLKAMAALGLHEIWWLVSPGNPLKPAVGMAPLAVRFANAEIMARRAPIRVSAIERALDTRYTRDTLKKLVRRWPRRRFIWIMGADNLAQFHQWKGWRDIARTMPIAVILRPGYNGAAFASPAMIWLRRYRMSAASFRSRKEWSSPALVILHFNPDKRSATALRRQYPQWAETVFAGSLRDHVTRRPVLSGEA